jgi:PTH1 family peptidyl-tRNA hydrolase
MKIVVGLGNPGKQYEGTRHNVGWMVLDRFADRAGLSGHAKSRDAAATMRGRYNGLDVLLVKPMTYMNESGVAVRKALARERAPLDEMLVVYDDFDLPLGRLRMREQGSAGTHNGMRSIIGELGNQKFARLRVGIGEPSRGAAIGHVLSRFANDERKVLDEVLDAAADAIED